VAVGIIAAAAALYLKILLPPSIRKREVHETGMKRRKIHAGVKLTWFSRMFYTHVKIMLISQP
jgi:hypothetical protein